MTAQQDISSLFVAWSFRVGRAMELLWLLTIFLVPLAFVTSGLMDNPYDVPKVTLYRTLVGMMGALWIIEWGLAVGTGKQLFRTPLMVGVGLGPGPQPGDGWLGRPPAGCWCRYAPCWPAT